MWNIKFLSETCFLQLYPTVRSLKISEQIDMLGQLLSNNGIDVKVNKYNILTKVTKCRGEGEQFCHLDLLFIYQNV